MLRDGFRAEGIIRLPNARIGGDLETQKGIFSAAALVLENASSSSIVDDDQSWPGKGNLYLDGFLYGRISEKAPRDSQTRLKWLKLQPEKPFMPQPYLHLAKVLKEAGDDAGAVIVLEEMERNHRHQQDRTPTDRLTSWVFDESIGYGYDPGRAIWMILGLSALGWILYRRSYLAGNIVPTDKDAYESFKSEGRPPAHYLAFAPLVYSVENSLPLVKLGQADLWQPDPNPGPPARQALWTTRLGPQTAWPRLLRGLQKVLVFVGLQTPGDESKPRSRLCRWGTSPRVLRWFLWVQILLGWLLATLFVAGVTGIVHKE